MGSLQGLLDLGKRSLQVQQTGIEVAGHNLSNVNNPSYSRQRLSVRSSEALQSAGLVVGTGVEASRVEQLRSEFIDKQIQGEGSVGGYLEARQSALQFLQTGLGEVIDTQSGSSGTVTNASAAQAGIANAVSSLFGKLQTLSRTPSDQAARGAVTTSAQDLAAKFRGVSGKLDDLASSLADGVSSGVGQANQLLGEIASINKAIAAVEMGSGAVANDLRDTRQGKLEELGKLLKVETSTDSDGNMAISAGGVILVDGGEVSDTLKAATAVDGSLSMQSLNGGVAVPMGSGSIQGMIDARDTDLKALRDGLDQLASTMMSSFNAAHAGGVGLDGSTGRAFFTGTSAADIAVNASLVGHPERVQLSSASGASADNSVVLAMANLADAKQTSLGGLTFAQSYSRTVTDLGERLASTNARLEDHQTVQGLLTRQRESVSGVSLDEEMTDMIKYQKAYQASARIISMVDQMLDEVINMKR